MVERSEGWNSGEQGKEAQYGAPIHHRAEEVLVVQALEDERPRTRRDQPVLARYPCAVLLATERHDARATIGADDAPRGVLVVPHLLNDATRAPSILCALRIRASGIAERTGRGVRRRG